MNMEPFDIVDGYARKLKTKPAQTVRVRHMTLAEVKELSGYADIIGNDGTLRTVKINGAVKTWKTDPGRIEVPVKYGMREYARFDTAEALRRFVVRIPKHECTPVQNASYYGLVPYCGVCGKTL